MRNGDAANVRVKDPGLEFLRSTNKVLALNKEMNHFQHVHSNLKFF